MKKIYDTIVVGGGHAGSEAAFISSQMGGKTLLITMNLQNIAQMSCNPAMGGVAKGQIIREIDALGGKKCLRFRFICSSVQNAKPIKRSCHVEPKGAIRQDAV